MATPLQSINKSATMAWCPVGSPNIMALGATGGGVMSADFSQPQISLDFVQFDPAGGDKPMNTMASIPVQQRFNSISWSGRTNTFSGGLLCGGLSEGVVSLWDPHAIITSGGQNTGLVHTMNAHQGQDVTCVEFHPDKSNLIASCGADSEVNIINIDNPTTPEVYKPGTASKRVNSEVTSLAWNRKVPHILCSCSNAGQSVVWDLKTKKEVISFRDPASRQRVSSVAWNPDVPTQLAVAYDDDRNPCMQFWDLRKHSYPYLEAAGHSKGILALSWNPMDSGLLMSAGKDNRTVCWSLNSGQPEVFSEIVTPHWNFEAKWSPQLPAIVAMAEVNGSVSVHSMQQSQSASRHVPKWYKRSCGATFGFAGKLAKFGGNTTTASMYLVPNEPEIAQHADQFESVLSSGDLSSYARQKGEQAGDSHEKMSWDLIQTLFDPNFRNQIVGKLGFSTEKIAADAEQYLGMKPGSLLGEAQPEAPPAPQAPAPEPQISVDEAEDFFTSLADANEQREREEEETKINGEKSDQFEKLDAINWASGPELLIKQSLLVGDLTCAVECCMKAGRMADALLLASGGPRDLWMRTRDEYMKRQDDKFLKMVGCIMSSDLNAMIKNSDLDAWQESLAIISTYADHTNYQTLCMELAERLRTEKFDVRSALICTLSAADFPKTVEIWSTMCSGQSTKNLALQELVEKMAVLQAATKFRGSDEVFTEKVTEYAEILANSGRLTSAMRYLLLLPEDKGGVIKDRIYNAMPNSVGVPAPAFPYQRLEVRPMMVQQQGYQRNQGFNQQGSGFNQQQRPAMNGQQGQQGSYQGQRQNMPYQQQPGQYQAPAAQPAAPAPSQNFGGAPRPGLPGNPGLGTNPGLAQHSGMAGGRPGMGGAPSPHGSAANLGQGFNQPGMNQPGMSQPGMPQQGMPQQGMNQQGMNQPAYGQQPVMNQPAYGQQAGMQPAGMGQPMNGMGHGMSPGGMNGHHAGMAQQGMGGQAQFSGAGQYGAANVRPPAQNTGPSTAPAASAVPPTAGLPVSWPCPTSVQQKSATNRATEGANKQVQSASANVMCGTPLSDQQLFAIQGPFDRLFDIRSQQDNNKRKQEDIRKKLTELYTKLQAGQIGDDVVAKVQELANAVAVEDMNSAHRIQADLSTTGWDQNKSWLIGVQRLLRG